MQNLKISRKPAANLEDWDMNSDQELSERERYKKKLKEKYEKQFSEYKIQLKPYNSSYEHTQWDGYIQK